MSFTATNQIKKDLKNLTILNIDEKTCDIFLNIMGEYVLSHKLTLPDGFIAASSLANDFDLFTLNVKDYRFIEGIKLYRR